MEATGIEPYLLAFFDYQTAGCGVQAWVLDTSAGTPIPVNDIWIAAATIDCGGHLLTFDRDFRRVAGLDLTLLAE